MTMDEHNNDINDTVHEETTDVSEQPDMPTNADNQHDNPPSIDDHAKYKNDDGTYDFDRIFKGHAVSIL